MKSVGSPPHFLLVAAHRKRQLACHDGPSVSDYSFNGTRTSTMAESDDFSRRWVGGSPCTQSSSRRVRAWTAPITCADKGDKCRDSPS